MDLGNLSTSALDAAEATLGNGPVTMVNLLWFQPDTNYAAGILEAKPDPRSAYYEGYAGAFMEVVQELGIGGIEVVFSASHGAGLVAAPADDWDDILVVRYRSFADFRRVVESESYDRLARPHHVAAIADFRLIATRGR